MILDMYETVYVQETLFHVLAEQVYYSGMQKWTTSSIFQVLTW
jgi:hypothetical protein